jgi:protein-L-isoaspartate(D-aspartate) O-methyltransferase
MTTTTTGDATTGAPSTIGTAVSATQPIEDRDDERLAMVEKQIEARAVEDPLVLEAIGAVPRHRFVSEDWEKYAYGDHPLPIGYGQTISQPYIVALMTEALGAAPGDRVLEIGTGSGYQAAVLAEMGLEVYTMEIIPDLAATAKATLDELGYEVTAREADGYFGWREAAPYDGIVVTAAPDHVPQPLVEQLAPGGVMVIPVGPIGAVQTLWRFSVDDNGELTAESLGSVSFVPFTRAPE